MRNCIIDCGSSLTVMLWCSWVWLQFSSSKVSISSHNSSLLVPIVEGFWVLEIVVFACFSNLVLRPWKLPYETVVPKNKLSQNSSTFSSQQFSRTVTWFVVLIFLDWCETNSHISHSACCFWIPLDSLHPWCKKIVPCNYTPGKGKIVPCNVM